MLTTPNLAGICHVPMFLTARHPLRGNLTDDYLAHGPYPHSKSGANLTPQKVLARILQNRSREAILLPMGSARRVQIKLKIPTRL
jgi:hypothetical protein